MLPSTVQKIAPRVVEVRAVEIVFIVEVRSNDGTEADMRNEADMHGRLAAEKLGLAWSSVRCVRLTDTPVIFRVAVSGR